MKRPLLSILIPVYNASAVLDETLDSVTSQVSAVDAEVIALDDGSTDDSGALLARRGSDIQYFRQENQGVSVARNRLASMARGEWLLFLDADDLLLPDTLEQRVLAVHDSDVDGMYCDWRRFRDDAGTRIWDEPIRKDIEDVHADAALALFSGFWSPPGAWMWKRSLHQAIGGYRTDLPVIQDARYAFDAAIAGARLWHDRHLGFAYRDGQAQSLSRRDNSRFARDCLLHAQQVEKIFAASGRTGSDAQIALASTYEYAARELAGSDPLLSVAALQSALRNNATHASRWVRTANALTRCLGARAGLALTSLMGRTGNRLRART